MHALLLVVGSSQTIVRACLILLLASISDSSSISDVQDERKQIHFPEAIAASNSASRIQSFQAHPIPSLAHGNAPHIHILCAPNAGCTSFAVILCILLDITACRPDEKYQPPHWVVPSNERVLTKSTTFGKDDPEYWNGFERKIIDKSYSKYNYNIVLIRDPVQNYLSIVRKPWCNAGGGLFRKFRNSDNLFKVLLNHTKSQEFDPFLSNFDMVIRSEEVTTSEGLRDVLEKLKLLDYTNITKKENIINVLEAEALTLVHRYGTGNKKNPVSRAIYERLRDDTDYNTTNFLQGDYDGGTPKSRTRPAFCQAVLAAHFLMPHTFKYYHPENAKLIEDLLALPNVNGSLAYPYDSVLNLTNSRALQILDDLGCIQTPMLHAINNSGGCIYYRPLNPSKPVMDWERRIYQKECVGNCLCCQSIRH